MSRSKWVSAGVLGLGLCVLGPVWAQAQSTCKFEVRSRSKVGYRGTAKYFIKGDWVREEKRSGGGLELIMVSNEKGLFIRNKHSNYWFKYPFNAKLSLKDRLLGGPVGDVPAFLKNVKAKKTGADKIKNQPCSIYSYKFPKSTDRFRLWISDKTGKPVQLERDHIVRGPNKRDILVVEYKSYEYKTPLQDSLFRIPANEKVHAVDPNYGKTLAAGAAAKTDAPANQ